MAGATIKARQVKSDNRMVSWSSARLTISLCPSYQVVHDTARSPLAGRALRLSTLRYINHYFSVLPILPRHDSHRQGVALVCPVLTLT